MGLFTKKVYSDEIIPEINGNTKAMTVTMKNFPVRKEASSGKLKLYVDYGTALVEVIAGRHHHLEYEEVKQGIQRTGKYVLNVPAPHLPEMTMEISGSLPDEDQFVPDLFWAFTDAFERNNIKT